MASSREGLPRQEQSIRGRARVKARGEEVRMRVSKNAPTRVRLLSSGSIRILEFDRMHVDDA